MLVMVVPKPNPPSGVVCERKSPKEAPSGLNKPKGKYCVEMEEMISQKHQEYYSCK